MLNEDDIAEISHVESILKSAKLNEQTSPAPEIKTKRLSPFQHIDCSYCPANVHQYNPEPDIHVVGNCGAKSTRGGCFGIIFYPVKNPSENLNKKLCNASIRSYCDV